MKRTFLDLKPSLLSSLFCDKRGREGGGTDRARERKKGGRERRKKKGEAKENFKQSCSEDICQVFRQLS